MSTETYNDFNIERIYNRGLLYFNEHNYKDAYTSLMNSLKRVDRENVSDIDMMKYYTLLFKSAYHAHEYQDIISYGKIALNESNPEYKDVLVIMRNLSEGHRFSKNIKSIFHVIDYDYKLIDMGYDVENSYISLARSYYKLYRYEDMYKASLNIKDEGEREFYEILYKSATGKFEDAIELANHYLSECPDNRIVTILLTYISNYIRLNDIDTAKYIYDSLIELEPNLKNNRLDSFFEYTYSEKAQLKADNYIHRQLKRYDPQHVINHLYKKYSELENVDLFDDKHKAFEYISKARDIIEKQDPYYISLADQYIYHEDSLKGLDIPTDEMVVLTLPNSKNIISMYPLYVSQDAGKKKSKSINNKRR
jgi:hypothetical protein